MHVWCLKWSYLRSITKSLSLKTYCHCIPSALLLGSRSKIKKHTIAHIWWWYHSLTAHKHQTGHTVPKQVIWLQRQLKSLQSKYCTVWEQFAIRPSLNKMSDKTWYPGCATGRLLSCTPPPPCHVGYSLEVNIFSQNDGDFVNARKGKSSVSLISDQWQYPIRSSHRFRVVYRLSVRLGWVRSAARPLSREINKYVSKWLRK